MAELYSGVARGRDKFDVVELLRLQEKLEADRANWDNHWENLARVMFPEADRFRSHYTRGNERHREIFDSTAMIAAERAAAVLESMNTPRQQRWHELRVDNDELNQDPTVKQWFEGVNRMLFNLRDSPRGNYYSNLHEGYKSLVVFGNMCLFVDEDDRGGVRYKNCHIGQIYIALNHTGRVDTVFRKYPMTAKAAYQQWKEQSPPKVLAALDRDPFKMMDFLHVVQPRKNVDPDSIGPDRMAWKSCYISIEDRELIGEPSGYQEFPYMYARWTVDPGEVHGRSPAMKVLPTVRMLQEMQRVFIESGRLAVEPPILLADDGPFGGARKPYLRPGGMNPGWLDTEKRAKMQPFTTGARLDITGEMIERERQVINQTFFLELYELMLDKPNMTATEVTTRLRERFQFMGPVTGRLQTELLGPQVERELGILYRQGRLPELPEALMEAEGEYRIEYVSEASRMQRADELLGIQRTFELAAPLAAADPTVWMRFDPEEILRIAQERNGAPSSILRRPEVFAELVAQQQQQAQADALPAQAREGAGALREGAQALQLLQGGTQ